MRECQITADQNHELEFGNQYEIKSITQFLVTNVKLQTFRLNGRALNLYTVVESCSNFASFFCLK